MQHTVAAIGVARILLAVSGALLLLYHVRTLAMSWNVDDERCEVIIKGYGPQPILFTEKNWSSLVQTYSRNESYELRRIREILHLKPGMRLCDVGAGDGTEVAKVGISVMPDGHLHSTGSACAEVHAQLAATRKVDPGATAAIGTPSNAGLAPASCDAMMARMSYHMMYHDDEARYMEYMRQFRAALAPSGTFLLMDHNADDPSIITRAGALHHGMKVVPLAAEADEATTAGFEVVETMDWPYFMNGYALVLRHPPRDAVHSTRPLPTKKAVRPRERAVEEEGSEDDYYYDM